MRDWRRPAAASSASPARWPRDHRNSESLSRRACRSSVTVSPTRRKTPMIVEFRTYRLKPGSVAEAEKRFGEGLTNRTKVSPLAAFWHTEVGPLNRIIHVWPYEDFAHRASVRSQKIEGWPPNIREFVEEQESEIFIPAPFSPKLEPRQLGGIYEIRTYTLAAGAIPAIIDRWSTQIAERTKLSPLAFAGHSELGGLN